MFMKQKKTLHALVICEGETYIARCEELLITEQGKTEEEALLALKKTIEELSMQYPLKFYPTNTRALGLFLELGTRKTITVTIQNKNTKTS